MLRSRYFISDNDKLKMNVVFIILLFMLIGRMLNIQYEIGVFL